MHYIIKSISYIFHPLLMPIAGVIFYFAKTPRYVDKDIIWAKLFSLSIFTIALPILLFFLLRTLGKVNSINLETPKERILPLCINAIIILIITKNILRADIYIELYYFFLGILISTLSCLILAVFKFKTSIHMIAISGLFMFFIALSIHFSINIINILALLSVIVGATATSRLYLKAHTYPELIMGLIVGAFPQLILITHWL